MKLVFMGTPEFAVSPLQGLLENGYEVAAVFTQPDKPKGRGHQLAFPPVKEIALQHNIPVYQPTGLKDEAIQATLREINPDLIVVVAYGKILPLEILELPRYGCINVHASLLPKYRGAGPIQWAIINGETETGVTTMYMAQGLDTGDMILKKSIPIGANETADELHDRLAVLGREVLLETIPLLVTSKAPRIPQNDAESCYAPMLSKELSALDLTRPAQEIHNRVRGLSSWPAAYLTLNGKKIKVYRSELMPQFGGKPGCLLDSKRFIVGCGDHQAIAFTEVQCEGAKRMDDAAFLRGHALPIGTQFDIKC